MTKTNSNEYSTVSGGIHSIPCAKIQLNCGTWCSIYDSQKSANFYFRNNENDEWVVRYLIEDLGKKTEERFKTIPTYDDPRDKVTFFKEIKMCEQGYPYNVNRDE